MVSCTERLTGVLLLLGEELADLLANLTIGDLDIVLGVAVIGHQGQEVIIGDVELPIFALEQSQKKGKKKIGRRKKKEPARLLFKG